MVDEKITIGELGGYTNNISNKEGIKKVVKAINDGLEPDLSAYQKKLTAGNNITITEEDVISATVEQLIAGNGITIDSNKINLSDYKLYGKINYGDLVENGKLKYDIVFVIHSYATATGITDYYIPVPKGIDISPGGYNLNIRFSNYMLVAPFSNLSATSITAKYWEWIVTLGNNANLPNFITLNYFASNDTITYNKRTSLGNDAGIVVFYRE